MPPPTNAQLFLEISVWLTGFSETELQATGMAESYYLAVQSHSDSGDLSFFLAAAHDILYPSTKKGTVIEDAIATRLMPVSGYGGLARKIIILWYTGNWEGEILSANAYIQGLMWNAGHTHPAGAKQPGYGSWAELPSPLSTQKPTDGQK